MAVASEAAAEDCPVDRGTVPPGETIAARTFRLIAAHPYRHTSGDIIFTVWADRAAIPEAVRPDARRAFYATGRACLRASDLGRRYGWGIHADSAGRLALVGMETEAYAEFLAGRRSGGSGAPVRVVKAMRRSRPRGG